MTARVLHQGCSPVGEGEGARCALGVPEPAHVWLPGRRRCPSPHLHILVQKHTENVIEDSSAANGCRNGGEHTFRSLLAISEVAGSSCCKKLLQRRLHNLKEE